MRRDLNTFGTSRPHPRWETAVLCLVLGLALLPAVALAGQEVTLEGVVHVKNGATPAQGTQTLKLERLWSSGGDDEGTLFGLISQVQIDEQQNIYLLDTQLSEVKVLSPTGEALRTLSRKGEGPGEVQTPIDMLFMPDGSIGLVQAFPGRIVKVDRQGNPAGSFTLGGDDPTKGGFVVLLDAKSRGTELVIAGMQIQAKEDGSGQSRIRFLSSYAPDGKEVKRYVERSTTLDYQNIRIVEADEYFVFPRRWALDKEGRIFAATERDRYTITVYNVDGTVARVIEREYERPRRTEKETARIQAAFDAQSRQAPVKIDFKMEDYEPVISNIEIRENGEVWVSSSASTRNLPAGVLRTYDVFDSRGNFIRQVAVACDGDGDEDGLFFFGGDRALLVRGLAQAALALQGGLGGGGGATDEEEAEPMEVVCYAIKS